MSSDLLTALLRSTERGQSLDNARISLLNAGYSQQDVQIAINEIQGTQKQVQISPLPKLETKKAAISLPTISSLPPIPSPPNQVPKPKISSKKQNDFSFIILILFIMIVISGALTIGIFFEQIKSALFG